MSEETNENVESVEAEVKVVEKIVEVPVEVVVEKVVEKVVEVPAAADCADCDCCVMLSREEVKGLLSHLPTHSGRANVESAKAKLEGALK